MANRKKNRRDQSRRSARRSSTDQKDPKPRILIVTEGRVTEPEYLKGLAKEVKNPLVELKIEPAAGVPITLVNKAKELKQGG